MRALLKTIMASWAPSLDIIIIIIIISVIVDQLLLHVTSPISEALAVVTVNSPFNTFNALEELFIPCLSFANSSL